MSKPSFTAEQLAWLKSNLPPGPFNRVLGDAEPTTDAQKVGAYALLDEKQRKQVDDQLASDKSAKEFADAQARLASAAAAVVAAAPESVDTKALEQAVSAVQSAVDATGGDKPAT